MTLVATASSVVPCPSLGGSQRGDTCEQDRKALGVGCVAGRGGGQGSWHSERERKPREREWQDKKQVEETWGLSFGFSVDS